MSQAGRAISLVDILGRRALPWHECIPTERSGGARVVVVTPATHSQLGIFTIPRADEPAIEPTIPVVQLSSTAAAKKSLAVACLLHGRQLCRVHPRRGDVMLDFDLTASSLSPRGVSLTSEATAQEALAKIAARHAYTSPFWLSLADITALSGCSGGILPSLGIANVTCDRAALAQLYDEASDVACTIVNDRGEEDRVVNLAEMQNARGGVSTVSASTPFFLFRKYTPVNVRTRAAFDPAVEDRLRVESICSGCWCSVWGTLEDFDACGCPALRGALGVSVLDALGNHHFLTNAMCTQDPVAAYAAAFPSHSVVFTQ